ncbi:hypothetical protein bcgnr5390_06110 [Bacillus luti]
MPTYIGRKQKFRKLYIILTFIEVHMNASARYDLYDICIAYAYVYINNKWVRCISEYYSIFRNRRER